MEDELLYRVIQSELKYFNFNRNSLGYQYLIEVIYLVAKKPVAMKSLTKNVYPKIAKKYKTKPENVQWCIEKLISLMCFNISEDKLMKYFDFHYYTKPTTKEFVIEIAKNCTNLIEKSEKF